MYMLAAGMQDTIYGWEVGHAEALEKPLPNPEMRRQFRSLFLIKSDAVKQG